jgi:hypothetical protein
MMTFLGVVAIGIIPSSQHGFLELAVCRKKESVDDAAAMKDKVELAAVIKRRLRRHFGVSAERDWAPTGIFGIFGIPEVLGCAARPRNR